MISSASSDSRSRTRLFTIIASSPRTRATSAFCADSGITCSRDRSSVRAVSTICRSSSDAISASDLRSSQSRSILFSTTIERGTRPCTYFSQSARSLAVTPVSVASRNSTACALGIMLTVSSGSLPRALRPGVSRITRPLFSSGCGKLISAWRHAGMSTRSWRLRITVVVKASPSWSSPRALASAMVTFFVCASIPKDFAIESRSSRSRRTFTHSCGRCFSARIVSLRPRVSIGRSRM